MEIGDRIREARKRDDLTQVELAKVLDVLPLRVSMWERGTSTPSRDGVRRLRAWKPNLF